jgi:plasmid stabilization system protein ParE
MSGYRFLPEASEELRAAAERYDAESAGLGRELVLDVRRVCRSISEAPHIGRMVRNDIRRRLVRRFPYSVLYCIESDDVLIVAVAHHHRAPGYWRNRV